MQEQDVTHISELFGLEKEIVQASEKDGTLGQRIKDVISKKYVDNTTLETFKKNYKDEIINGYFNELVTGAKKGDIPQEIYKPIKGAALQQKERELSQKFNITEYSGIDDLIDKAISKTTANGKSQPEYDQKINELKEANKKLLHEKEEAIKTVETEYRSRSLERDKVDMISKVPFDLSDVKSDELENKKQKIQNILKSVFDSEYKMDYDDKQRLVVINKEGKVVRNQATLDPVSPLDVMIDVAKDYNLKLISPDKGGQGGQSSEKSGSEFHDIESFERWCESKNIQVTSPEAVKAFVASGLRLKK